MPNVKNCSETRGEAHSAYVSMCPISQCQWQQLTVGSSFAYYQCVILVPMTNYQLDLTLSNIKNSLVICIRFSVAIGRSCLVLILERLPFHHHILTLIDWYQICRLELQHSPLSNFALITTGFCIAPNRLYMLWLTLSIIPLFFHNVFYLVWCSASSA